MKILSLHWGFSLGGVAKYAATIEHVRELAPIVIRSVCFLPAGRVVDREALACLDATIVEVPSILNLSWIRQLRKTIEQEAPDCILSHGFNGHLLSLLGRGAVRGDSEVVRLATYHGSYHATTGARKLVEPIYNSFTHWFMRNKAKSVLNVAQYCADFLAKQGVDSTKLEVVHNGIPDYTSEPGKREAIRSEWGFGPEHTLIGVASRLDPVKGLEYLVEAFADLSGKNPWVRLVLMGGGTVRSELDAQVSALGISDRVLFVGMRKDVPDCLAALDLFALPSLAEYHSIGLLEAMRAGLPIVATDVGGNTESVRDGQEGLIVKSADAIGLADALGRMLGDADLRERLAAAAQQRFVIEFTEVAMLNKTAAWLQKVCKC